MALGRREGKQAGMWVTTKSLPRSPGHVFYEKLNGLLDRMGFDRRCEELCEPYYAEVMGRRGIPPGVYFRMLMVGFFEGLGAQRAIAWKCADSLSVRAFVGVEISESAPDHSSLTRIRQRLPLEIHLQVFQLVLEAAKEHGLLRGKTIAVDATTLEANAAMKSMVRRVSGEDWKAYLRRLAEAEGLDDPSDEDLRRFDRKRKDKKVSNKEWMSPVDPDSRIMKMKDGRTRFMYKAEHAVDIDSDLVVAAQIYEGDTADGDSILTTVDAALENLEAIGSEESLEEVLGDKGYHKIEALGTLGEVFELRTYIPERQDHIRHNWRNRPAGDKDAFYANRRRVQGRRGRGLSRKRSEFVERSFAHTCNTGGGRRTWLRGRENVAKRNYLHLAARNLGVIMRVLFGVGTPRSLQGVLCHVFVALLTAIGRLRDLTRWLGRWSGRVAPAPVDVATATA